MISEDTSPKEKKIFEGGGYNPPPKDEERPAQPTPDPPKKTDE